jgi:hypothetical protein
MEFDFSLLYLAQEKVLPQSRTLMPHPDNGINGFRRDIVGNFQLIASQPYDVRYDRRLSSFIIESIGPVTTFNFGIINRFD